MGYIGILIVAVLMTLGVFVFRGSGENQETIIEDGSSVVDEAERIKSQIENRNNEMENESR